MDDLNPEFQRRGKTLVGMIMDIFRKFRGGDTKADKENLDPGSG